MILVTFKEFKEFLDKRKMLQPIIFVEKTPCILQYKDGDKVLGKVELSNLEQFKFLLKYPKSLMHHENKYWIRGEERVVSQFEF